MSRHTGGLPRSESRSLASLVWVGVGAGASFFTRRRKRRYRPYEGSVRLLHQLRARGTPCAVVSSSRNTRTVLRAAGAEVLHDGLEDQVAVLQRGQLGLLLP